MEDFRISWIRSRACAAYDVEKGANAFFVGLAEDGTVEEVFDSFVGRIESGCEEGKSSTLVFLHEKREVEIEIQCDSPASLEPKDDNEPPIQGQLNDDKDISNGNSLNQSRMDQESETENTTEVIVQKTKKQTIIQTTFKVGYSDQLTSDPQSYFYIVRSCDEEIPTFKSSDEADLSMPMFCSTGFMNGSPLLCLEQILTQVYIPLLSFNYERNNQAIQQLTLRRPKSPRRSSSGVVPENENSSVQLSKTSKEQGHHHGNRKASMREAEREELTAKSLLRDEFVMKMESFAQTLKRTELELYQEAEYDSVDCTVLDEFDESKYDLSEYVQLDHVKKELLQAFAKWHSHTRENLSSILAKFPQGKGPLPEVEFWQERSEALGSLVEGLKAPRTTKLLHFHSFLDASNTAEYLKQDILKLNAEAKDNARFLSTLSRHFRNLTHGASFQAAEDALGPLMNALRMMWVVSKNYNTDERMVPLMERIAWELRERVYRTVVIRELFNDNTEVVKKKTSEAKKLLDRWHTSYLEMRLKIEMMGRDARWEFDRKKLFEHTDYMAMVCGDLHEMAEVFEDFHGIFGQELKLVVGDDERISKILRRVDALVEPISKVPFDIFSPKYRESWVSAKDRFQAETSSVEVEAKNFLDDSFRNLRSADGAFEMLKRFQNVKTRRSLNALLSRKFTDVLVQFQKEVENLEKIFMANCSSPPIPPNMPPVAGAIAWERELFLKMKRTMTKFIRFEDLMQTDHGRNSKTVYLNLAKQMKSYEEKHFEKWKEMAVVKLPELLKKNLLLEIPSLLATVTKKSKVKETVFTAALSKRPKYVVNFDPQILVLIAETKHLEVMKFPVPDLTRNIALQEQRLKKYSDQLTIMLDSYHKVLHSLDDAEIVLLEPLMNDLERVLNPGVARLNWNALGVLDFVAMCNNAITTFTSTVSHVKKNASDINKLLNKMEISSLFKYPIMNISYSTKSPGNEMVDDDDDDDRHDGDDGNYDKNQKDSPKENPDIKSFVSGSFKIEDSLNNGEQSGEGKGEMMDGHHKDGLQSPKDASGEEISGDNAVKTPGRQKLTNAKLIPQPDKLLRTLQLRLYGCKTFFQKMEDQRTLDVLRLVEIYRTIGPLLVKLENMLFLTSTGSAPGMKKYYLYWERRIFETLLQMVTNNLRKFKISLGGVECIFQVEVMLVGYDVIMSPGANDVYQLILQSARDCIERLKMFVRWMHGTCSEASPQKVPESDDTRIFSFFDDVVMEMTVHELLGEIQEVAKQTIRGTLDGLMVWKKFGNFWKSDKIITVEKWFLTNPSVVQFDEKFQFFECAMEELLELPPIDSHLCLLIHLKPLIQSIKQHIEGWTEAYARALFDSSAVALDELMNKLKSKIKDLDREPEHLDDLKFILTTISDIKVMSLDTEVDITRVQERFRTINIYKLQCNMEKMEEAGQLNKVWAELLNKGKAVDVSLYPVKKKFRQLTLSQIKEFKQTLAEFKEKFISEGPGCVDDDLERGLELLTVFKKQLDDYLEQRQELKSAEKLFDMPITVFQDLLHIQKDMKGLEQLYSIYKEQKEARRQWAECLWADLNMVQLQDGTEGFLKALRRLPKEVKSMSVCHALEERMKEFRDSLPLFVDLKHEALRERHWKELMEKTGQKFDMNPESLTLSHIFAMQLHRFQEKIGEVVNCAIKESANEKGLKEIEDTWSSLKFNIQRYTKGNADRGHILGSLDDTIQLLDDNTMQLQGMSVSRFIGPFLGSVQKWEKCLAHISEVLEVWMIVQRKWMYLEGIFVGGDIRAQLPEEAKQFDEIDRTFKRIMAETAKSPVIKHACHVENRLSDLRSLSQGLEKCQKSLNDYLDTKRNSFPRFFFISDDELLSILGSSDPMSLQEHMIKVLMTWKCLTLECDYYKDEMMIRIEL